MAGNTSYPGALDTTTNLPIASALVSTELDGDSDVNKVHSNLHGVLSEAAVAIEAKIGTGASTPVADRVLRGSGTGASAWAQVALATDVSGTLPLANGGTGVTTLTDDGVLIGSGSGVIRATSAGTAGQILTSGGTGVAPDWGAAPGTYSDAQAVSAVEAETTLVLSSGMTVTNAVLTTPTLGTPTNLTLTNATGLPAAGVVGTASTLSGVQTLTGTKTLNGTSSTTGVVLLNAAETTTITATVPPATVNFDAATQSVLVYTTNATATWITNLRFSSGTTMNTALAVGQSLSVTLMAAQGGTAYLGTTFNIDGTTVTPLWQGGIPTAAGASGTDVYTYTITKTASATYRVLASMSSFA